MTVKVVYLDCNATTPIDPRVADAMLPFIHEHFGNPSSSHAYGVIPRRAVEKAREQVSALLGAQPHEIIFTSGGTESNNHAIMGAARACRSRGSHIITSTVEHPAVTEVFADLEREGFRTTYVPVDGNGRVHPEAIERAITPETVLITVMHANNEGGTVNSIREIADLAHGHGILMHPAAAQSVGKIPVRVDALNVDLLSVAGHKLYAPKGVGALYVRQGLSIPPLVIGASQERGIRPGTENVLEIVGLGAACEIAGENIELEEERLMEFSNLLWRELLESLGSESIRWNGHPQQRLPNTLSVSFLGIKANALLDELDEEVAASAGAACHADSVEISSVLKAMTVPEEWAKGTLRLSLGRFTTPAEIHQAARAIATAVRKLRR
ncbi:MAG: cysteine desulfurase [Syntrophobacteraceae bacterium]|nr:cysteine desulfurase [Syntrophobacteraceae bacterium]